VTKSATESTDFVVDTNHESSRRIVSDIICVTDFHDLCLQPSRGLCRKVGIMEFGLYSSLEIAHSVTVIILDILLVKHR